MISKELQSALNVALGEARKRRHEYFTIEHLLFALLQDPAVIKIIHACGGSIQNLLKDLEKFFDEQLQSFEPDAEKIEVQTSISVQRVLQRAIFHTQSSGKSEVLTPHVLVALFSEKDSHAVFFLNKQGISRLDVVSYISHGISKLPADSEEGSGLSAEEEKENESTSGDILERFAVNLNRKASEGKIDPLIGREAELERTIQVLCRRRKNNPLYVGDAGVGKTAIAEGLALKIVQKNVPSILQDSVVYSLDMGAMLAGTKFRGDFEQRLKSILNRLKKDKNAILLIDEIHTIIGAGATTGGTMDASNLLKPALSSGELKCIGSTTYQEYKLLEKDRALNRRFQKIDIPEPSIDDTVKILQGLKTRFEEYHEVEYTPAALVAAVKLSAKYINDRHLPDKAIDIIDEVGAALRLRPDSEGKKTVDEADIETIVAKMARIPPKSVSSSDKESLKNLEQNLKQTVFGQNEAVEMLVTSIKLARSGLRQSDKPIGAFLFCGPTGVGKTELSKELARILGIQFIRFDMSEYMEKHTVSRLIGAPPGYVGYEEGGQLTEAVRHRPYSIVLLDEIEKAHADVFNVLLQVLDDGHLTDGKGRQVNFKNTIIIMTSNLGSNIILENFEDLGAIDANKRGEVLETTKLEVFELLKQTMRPEFLNRVDETIMFLPLTKDEIERILFIQMSSINKLLKTQELSIQLEPSAVNLLVGLGYDPQFGARPLKRVLQRELINELSKSILSGEFVAGDVIVAEGNNTGLTFHKKNVEKAILSEKTEAQP